MRYLILNGPNLNLLGTREPEVYGSTTLTELEAACRAWAGDLGATVETYQSNHEGALIDRLHAAAADSIDGVVFNPAAFTHTSYALHDAIEAVELPVVEVHISNVEEREPWRRVSLVRPACLHTVFGRGVEGYGWAIRHLHWNRLSPGARLAYGDDPDQFLVARTPPRPEGMVVLVHGGFWRGTWGFDTIEGPAVDLASAGVATAVIEYRRTGPRHPGPHAIVDDVEAAVRRACESTGIAPDRTVLVGHSAGGQLAALVAGRLRPRGLVTVAGVLDLVAGAELGDGAVADFLAGADPDDFSPASHVARGVPTVVVSAAGDNTVPAGQAESYVAASGGEPVTHVEIPGGHMDVLDPASEGWRELRPLILDQLAAGPA